MIVIVIARQHTQEQQMTTSPSFAGLAAVDIGSGMMKFRAVASNGVVISETVSVPFAFALAQSSTNQLPRAVMDDGVRQLQRFVDKAQSLGVTRIDAVATAIFRKATNGAEFLARVQADVPAVSLRIISQQDEGELGYGTALHALALDPPPARIVSVDAGGASFQIATRLNDSFVVFNGPHGSVTSLQSLLALRGTEVTGSPNPVAWREIASLCARLSASFPPRPAWLDAIDVPIVAIGDATSSFAVVARESGKCDFARGDVESALRSTCGLSDDEILARGHPQPELCASKLALLLCIFDDALGEKAVISFRETEGSCLGVLALMARSKR